MIIPIIISNSKYIFAGQIIIVSDYDYKAFLLFSHHDAIIIMMRTTIDIELLRIIKDLAVSEDVSLGKIVSRLLRDALKPKEPIRGKNDDFPTLPINKNARVGTLELVNRLRDNIED